METQYEGFLTIDQTAKFLAVSSRQVRELIKNGDIRAVNINANKQSERRILRILKADLVNLRKLPVPTQEEVNQ